NRISITKDASIKVIDTWHGICECYTILQKDTLQEKMEILIADSNC
ncbi:839_t:CDS:2, partial [Racocetra persica]